ADQRNHDPVAVEEQTVGQLVDLLDLGFGEDGIHGRHHSAESVLNPDSRLLTPTPGFGTFKSYQVSPLYRQATHDPDDAADRLRDHAAHALRPGRKAPHEERARTVGGGETAPADRQQDPQAAREARTPGGPPRRPRRLHPEPEAGPDHDGQR